MGSQSVIWIQPIGIIATLTGNSFLRRTTRAISRSASCKVPTPTGRRSQSRTWRMVFMASITTRMVHGSARRWIAIWVMIISSCRQQRQGAHIKFGFTMPRISSSTVVVSTTSRIQPVVVRHVPLHCFPLRIQQASVVDMPLDLWHPGFLGTINPLVDAKWPGLLLSTGHPTGHPGLFHCVALRPYNATMPVAFGVCAQAL